MEGNTTGDAGAGQAGKSVGQRGVDQWCRWEAVWKVGRHGAAAATDGATADTVRYAAAVAATGTGHTLLQ